MAKETVTFSLNGQVSLAEFAGALVEFNDMVGALASEISSSADITWEVAHLASGSAIMTFRGYSPQDEVVERVVQAVEVVADLENHQPIPYSDKVAKHAYNLTAYIGGGISGITFITDGHKTIITEPVKDDEEPGVRYTLGAITGYVETLVSHNGIGCTIYDPITNHAIKCVVKADQKEDIRNVWAKRVTVIGEIRRDPKTGRPLEIRNIISIRLAEIAPENSYKRTRGTIPWKSGDPLPEQRIRRLRDDT